uniref:Uncharacterized protein n=1 Tax=Zea mays TaxID=4577 RepID=B6TE88_MAIZE|nr:hypothetical protein [Zea mays]
MRSRRRIHPCGSRKKHLTIGRTRRNRSSTQLKATAATMSTIRAHSFFCISVPSIFFVLYRYHHFFIKQLYSMLYAKEHDDALF